MTRRSALCLLTGPMVFAQSGIAGKYKGKWEGMSASGEFEISLQQDGGEWKAEVGFSLGDNAVPASVVFLKVSGENLEVKYVFELGGVKLQSHLTGSFQSTGFAGKYKTQTVADAMPVDEGSCTAKRV